MERKIARFNQRLTIQKNEVTVDRYGNHKNVWTDYFSCFTYAEILDFDDVIWEQDIPGIVESLRRFGINRFTISCEMSSMSKTIWAFEKNGCCLIRMTEVNTRFTDWEGKSGRKPAFEIAVLPA
jgi:hypothetical protein